VWPITTVSGRAGEQAGNDLFRRHFGGGGHVVRRRRVAIEDAVGRRGHRQGSEPIDVLSSEVLAVPVGECTLGIAADEDRPVDGSRELKRLPRERPGDQIASEDHGVGVDLRQNRFERPRHRVDVIQRRDAHLLRIGDLDEHAPPVAGGARANERAQSAGNPALAADHLADVVRRHVQHEDESIVALLGVHAHRVGVVDELAREVREQFGH